MRARGAVIQGALAVVGLGAAWAAWQREPDRAAGEVVVLDVGRRDVTKIRYEDGPRWVELEPGKADEVWMRVSARPADKTPERKLRGSEQAQRLVEKFAPLRASRGLGALSPDKLKEVGLASPKKRLEVTARGQKTVFLAGVSPYGVSSPYVKSEEDGRVYVLAGTILADLEAAPGWLVERRLHTFQPSEIEGLTVTVGDRRRELVQTGGANPLTSRLAPASSPDKPDAMARNWHDKLWRAAAVDVLGEGELPAAGDPGKAIVLRVDYTAGGKPLGHVEIGRVTPAAPTLSTTSSQSPSPPPPAAELYARSELTAGWIKLPSTTDELVKEAEKIVATP